MSVIAIDTSSRLRVVAVVAGAAGELLDARVGQGARVDQSLPPALAELAAGPLDAVVVVTGPGSYTGLRAGMAAALGLAHARGLPLHGVPAMMVVAAGSGVRGPVWAAADAGRGGLYAARCEGGEGARCTEARRVTVKELVRESGSVPIASCDELDVVGLTRVDPARALASAVPLALATGPMSLDGISAVYVT